MGGNVVSNLCSLPATDLNFTSELNRATAYQIKQAIETMKQNGGKNKGRIKACDRELENRRLTKKDKHGKYVSKEHLSILCNTFSSEHRLKAILNKLGEYEDAERQGLLLRLPCGIGTAVYEVENNADACSECNDFERGYCCDDYCGNENVHDEDGAAYVPNPQYADRPLCQKHFYEVNEYTMSNVDEIFNRRNSFGKTVFLTRDEAEAKLKEMEDEHGE